MSAKEPVAETPLAEKLSSLADRLDRVSGAVTVIKEQVASAVSDIRNELKALKKG